MTRSVTIVNTSNWEHEDVEVVEMNEGWPSNKVVLQPGDETTVGPYAKGQTVSVIMKAREHIEPVAFYDEHGDQDWPKVEVHKPVGRTKKD